MKKKLRINLVTQTLIECGPNITQRIYIEVTCYNDWVTPYTELTENGTKSENIKAYMYGIIYNGDAMSKKTGIFDWQPRASERNDSFFKEYRFDSFEEAEKAYLKFHGDENYFQKEIDRVIQLLKNKAK